MAGIKELMEAVNRDPYFERTGIPRDRDPWMPSVKYDNKLLAEIIKNDPQFQGTNVGVNPAAYLDPRYQSGITRYSLDIGNNKKATGEYYDLKDPRRQKGGRLWTSTDVEDPYKFLSTLAHENTHANTMERLNYDPSNHDHPGISPYLHDEIMGAYKQAFPEHAKDDIGYGTRQGNWTEPAAWAAGREAMLPSGQMPIQEEMNRRGLGALYAHMTTAGPVATRVSPSLIQRLQDFMNDEPSEEPYELRGNEAEKARRRK